MIDIKFLRENPEAVKENIRKKFQDSKLPLVDEVIELDKESRKTQQEEMCIRDSLSSVPTHTSMPSPSIEEVLSK